MKSRIAFALSGLFVIVMVQTVAAGQWLYLASTQAKNIVAYDVDAKTGKLTKKFEIGLPGNGGAMTFSPGKDFVYAAITNYDGRKAAVVTLRRSDDGRLKQLNVGVISTRAPYIRTDRSGRVLMAAHYGAGDVTTYRIADGVMQGKQLDHRKTERTAHCIEIDPSGRFVFVPHTAPNKVYQFRLDASTGRLTPNDPPFVVGPATGHKYHAPRHYAHHPKLNMAYTSNEFGGGITAWKFNPRKGTLTRVQTLSTLPPEYQGSSAAADIQITPDGRFAYVSNRDVTKRKEGQSMQDTLCAVALDAKTGKMKIVGHYATEFFPRSFCIDRDGKYLYAAGQRSATLAAYRIGNDGSLTALGKYQTGGTPIWVMCGPVK